MGRRAYGKLGWGGVVKKDLKDLKDGKDSKDDGRGGGHWTRSGAGGVPGAWNLTWSCHQSRVADPVIFDGLLGLAVVSFGCQ